VTSIFPLSIVQLAPIWQLSPILTIPICGFKLLEPLVLKSKPNPVVPIDVLSQIITLQPILSF